MAVFLGLDFGTSGARAILINANSDLEWESHLNFASEMTNLAITWKKTLFSLLQAIPHQFRHQLKSIAIDGTSATVLLCNQDGIPVTTPLLYHDSRASFALEKIKAIAPENHPVISATSSLAKLLWWQAQNQLTQPHLYLCHQADWLAFLLHGKLGVSDYHNALKLGYDVENLCYPHWLEEFNLCVHLPEILPPGTPIKAILPHIANTLNLPSDCLICAGTTDSIAAFLASGALLPGDAVTSLGSTLVLKLLSQTRIENSQFGIYSHKFGDLWLVGGASNTGGAVLKQFFSDSELKTLSQRINPQQTSPLDYYPLPATGDRFPINDPNLQPHLQPRPEHPVDFLHGLLQGIANIEAQGYHRLQQLGATPLTRVYTCGGGAQNPTWTAIRHRYLQVPLLSPTHTQAAYGSALLASRKNLCLRG